jgi:hypothetical protein
VRCDQARPSCHRCSSTGRKCDGFPLNESLSKSSKSPLAIIAAMGSSESSYRLLIEPMGLGEIEYRLFHFYASRTAAALDGFFQDDHWMRLVLQMSHRVDCVRYAVLALTCLHSKHCMTQTALHPKTSHQIGDVQYQAIKYYTMAVRHLNNQIALNSWAHLEETLLCCVLCVRFEWIAGNRAKALMHLRGSIQILREWQASCTSSSLSRTSFWSPGGHLIRSTISPLFVRLALEASMFAEKREAVPVPPRPLFTTVSQAFATVKDARDSLYDILGDEYLFRRQRSGLRVESDPTTCELTSRERFSHWSISLMDLLTRLDEDTKSGPAAITLRIWLKVVRVMLEMAERNYEETAFDDYTQEFSDAIDLATELYSFQASTFLAETSVVAVLFYVATKCRHSQTRRRAIALIESSPSQEGIWDGAVAIKTASGVMQAEEMASGGDVRSERDISQVAQLPVSVYVWEDWENHAVVAQ